MLGLTKREISNIHLAMNLAKDGSNYSKCVRSKVGSVIITPSEGFYLGINGTLAGEDNVCEIVLDSGELQTHDGVIHAEANALDKTHSEGISAKNCISVQTLSPCKSCITRMLNVGVKLIVYLDEYRNTEHLVKYVSDGYVISYKDFCTKYK